MRKCWYPAFFPFFTMFSNPLRDQSHSLIHILFVLCRRFRLMSSKFYSLVIHISHKTLEIGCAWSKGSGELLQGHHGPLVSAEAVALNIALCSIQNNNNKKLIVFSDLLSVLQSFKHPDNPNPLIQQFFRKYIYLCRSKMIIFCWIPSHIHIKGNELADQEAKDAISMDIANIKIPYTGKKQQINEFIKSECQTKWKQCSNNKLFAIKPNFNDKCNFNCNRKEQIILTRCRIGHSRFSHLHLLNNERAPQCINCN